MEKYTYEEIAGMIDHALLHPTLSGKELVEGCHIAHLYTTATVCVKPCDVKVCSCATCSLVEFHLRMGIFLNLLPSSL